jgi:cytoskeletal protein RodZ
MNGDSVVLELRVLAGLQAGARLSLSDGRHVIGSGETCDIVLAGPGIGAQALVIGVEGAQLHLQPGQPGCGLTEGDSLSEPFMLEAGVPFHLGDVWLVIDQADRPWPENRSWLTLAPSSPAPMPMNEATTAHAAEPGAERQKPSHRPYSPMWWVKWLAWCVAVFCLGGLGVLVWFKYGMEYLPHMRAMTASHLSRLSESPAVAPAVQATPAKPAAPTQVVEPEPRTPMPSASSPVFLSPPPPVAPPNESPPLGLPLIGSHLVHSRSQEQTDRAENDTASAAELSRLPFVVRQVACGSVASITTDKGVKLFEGATYKGYELTKISPERLRLRGRHAVELSC